jgi:hypothetical protein
VGHVDEAFHGDGRLISLDSVHIVSPREAIQLTCNMRARREPVRSFIEIGASGMTVADNPAAIGDFNGINDAVSVTRAFQRVQISSG